MRRFAFYCIGIAFVTLSPTAHASTFTFDQDPFAGIDVTKIPGRQIVGGEDFLVFSPEHDVFSIDPKVFGVGNTVSFVNESADILPAGGVNVVVLENFDDDNNPLTPFGASNAADLIAGKITTPGPGFFIYFNQDLDLARLVYSTDLSDNNADLRILARMLNLFGAEGRNELPNFKAANFAFTAPVSTVPEPSSFFMILVVGAVGGCIYRKRQFHR